MKLIAAFIAGAVLSWFATDYRDSATAAQIEGSITKLRSACGTVPRMRPAPYRIIA